jgi:signal transduction histidine kinase
MRMLPSLTMSQKLLLVISLPLAAQGIFVGMLLRAGAENEQAQSWAVHPKEVIAKVEEIYRTLLEGHARIREVASLSPAEAERFDRNLDRVPGEIASLQAFVVDNPLQQARVDALAGSSRELLGLLHQQEQILRAGGKEPTVLSPSEADRLLSAIRTSVDGILTEEMNPDESRINRLRESRSRQLWVVVGGGAAVLAATIVLALLLTKGVTTRLGVLRENARRLSAGLGLEAPLFARDEIGEVDRAFHDMAATLQQQRQENEMFVYSVSHDLRSPLINLQGFSEELRISYRRLQTLFDNQEVPPALRREGKTVLSEHVEDSIRYIQTAVGRLARIIDAMLRLSRAGRVEYQWQFVDLAALLPKITAALNDTIEQRRARIVVHDLPPAWGDPTAVEQIFANLIGNAVAYLDPGRSGEIEVGCTPGSATDRPAAPNVYYVKDNGLGIAAAYHEKVFTAFSRLQANVPQGEGVGLALVHRMVGRHGGKIWLESTVGAGSTFFVALPSRPPDGTPPSSAQRSPMNNGLAGDLAACHPSRS